MRPTESDSTHSQTFWVMADFFICCFRSCLRGKDSENNQEYYDRLGLSDRGCSSEDIKRAFKRKSLEMHPDKLAQRGKTVTKEDQLAFQKMKDAYDCLSDPSKRRYYDEFGEGGLKMVESTQKMNFMDMLRNFQDNKFDCVLITLLLCIFFIFVLALPVLICLKFDGTISLPWSLIWIPMWIVDGILLLIVSLNLCCCVFDMKPNGDDEDSNFQTEHNAPISAKLYFFALILAFIAAQITLVMKADAMLTDSWLVAFAPLIAFEVLVIGGSLPVVTTKLERPDYTEISGLVEDPIEMQFTRIQMDNEYHKKMIDKMYGVKSIFVSVIRLIFIVLLSIKLDDDASMNWGLVFIPVWLYFIGLLFWGTYVSTLGAKLLRGIDTRIPPEQMDPVTQAEYQRAMTLVALGNSENCGLLMPVAIMTLLVLYLTVGGFSAFIVMIPVFILIGCCMCCTFCSLAFVSNVDVDKMEEEMEHANGGYRGGRDSSSFSRESENFNRNANGKNSYGTGNDSSSSTYAPPPAIDPNLKPKDMSLKELRQAISEAGLSAEAVGLSERQEFVILLESYRSRSTAAEVRATEAARVREQASSTSTSTSTAGDID